MKSKSQSMALVHFRNQNKNLLALGHLSEGRENHKNDMKIAEWIKENAARPKTKFHAYVFALNEYCYVEPLA